MALFGLAGKTKLEISRGYSYDLRKFPSSKSHSAIMNECLLLANFAFNAEMYDGDTA